MEPQEIPREEPGRKLNKGEMSVMDAIYGRHVSRSYASRHVSEQVVRFLLDCAIQAPSVLNAQPWAFVVLQNANLLRAISEDSKHYLSKRDDRKQMSEQALESFQDPSFDVFYGAKTLILICAKENERDAEAACAMAAQNLLLAAYSLGLGACPIGFVRDILQTDSYKGQLSIPKNYRPMLPIILGYPSGKPAKTTRQSAKILCWLS
jgi:nitroreductase